MYLAIITHNYYAPLARQVEELDRNVTLSLPRNHLDKNSDKWRRQHTSRKKSLQLGVLDGSIPLAISNTGATASAFTPSDPEIAIRIKSTATFGGAFGNQARSTTVNTLHHKICKPACSVHVVSQV